LDLSETFRFRWGLLGAHNAELDACSDFSRTVIRLVALRWGMVVEHGYHLNKMAQTPKFELRSKKTGF